MASTPRLICKYPNRRLYDTGASAYVTLDGLRELILDGIDFEVHEAAGNADVTRGILLQIIAEREQHEPPLLTATLLRRLIRLHGSALGGLVGTELEHRLDELVRRHRL